MKHHQSLIAIACIVTHSAVLFSAGVAHAQTNFATPELAVEAVAKAVSRSDMAELQTIFGPEAREILSSGDPVADQWNREVVSVALRERWELIERDANSRELVIGNERWPFAVPIVKGPEGWYFDTEAGAVEVLARRIGRNELYVIGICNTYVRAQNEYAQEGRDGNPAGIYARKFRSEPGKQDGLFWETKPGETPSPLGELFASASKEGYDGAQGSQSNPFHGYYFRILTAQGSKADGGATDYIVNGKMTKGFALIAFPSEYGNSGIMTFIVNHDGVVHERDLGPETAEIASQTTTYNPSRGWKVVEH